VIGSFTQAAIWLHFGPSWSFSWKYLL